MKYLVKHITKDGQTKQNRAARRAIIARIRHKGDTPHSLGKQYKKRQARPITGCRRQTVGQQ